MTPVITTRGLTKRYDGLVAVDGLDLEVQRGEIFGLLGPNGAGKTTTILMLLGLTEPTAGTARVFGEDPARNPIAIKRRTGYLPDNVGLYDHLTGRENLRYTAMLNRIPRAEGEARIQDLLERVGLAEAADRRAGGYSRGMRQRLGLADVLLKRPELVILDEPTVGLDPEGAHQLLELISGLRDEGITVLLSSHLLHQVQRVCNRVAIFVRGKVIASGPIDALGGRVLGGETVIEVGCAPAHDGVREAVLRLDGVTAVEPEGDRLLVRCRGDLRPDVARAVTAAGAALYHLALRGQDLEAIYRRYFRGESEGEHDTGGRPAPAGPARG